MKNVASTLLAVVLLLVMGMSLANAQTAVQSGPTSTDDLVTKQQLDRAVRKAVKRSTIPLENKINNNNRVLQGQMKDLEGNQKADAAKNAEAITVQNGKIDALGNTTGDIQHSISKIYWVLIAIIAIVAVAISVVIFFQKRILRKQKTMMDILANPNVTTLRSIWEEMEKTAFKGGRTIPFAKVLKINAEQGLMESATITGYEAFWPQGVDFRNTYPTILFNGKKLEEKLKELNRHAVQQARLQRAQTSSGEGISLARTNSAA